MTAPPMPDAAFPRAAGLVPGARELASAAWQAMYLDALSRGALLAVAGVMILAGLALIIRSRGIDASR